MAELSTVARPYAEALFSAAAAADAGAGGVATADRQPGGRSTPVRPADVRTGQRRRARRAATGARRLPEAGDRERPACGAARSRLAVSSAEKRRRGNRRLPDRVGLRAERAASQRSGQTARPQIPAPPETGAAHRAAIDRRRASD